MYKNIFNHRNKLVYFLIVQISENIPAYCGADNCELI